MQYLHCMVKAIYKIYLRLLRISGFTWRLSTILMAHLQYMCIVVNMTCKPTLKTPENERRYVKELKYSYPAQAGKYCQGTMFSVVCTWCSFLYFCWRLVCYIILHADTQNQIHYMYTACLDVAVLSYTYLLVVFLVYVITCTCICEWQFIIMTGIVAFIVHAWPKLYMYNYILTSVHVRAHVHV